MAAAPINPADLLAVLALYGRPTPAPNFPGGEGFGIVINSSVPNFQPGDRVVVLGGRTWRTYGIYHPFALLKAPNGVTVQDGATVIVNPTTALRMLSDFAHFPPKTPQDQYRHVVIQNAATGGVGQSVIQLATLQGLHTVNFIRSGGRDFDVTVKALKALASEEAGGPVVEVVDEEKFVMNEAYRAQVVAMVRALNPAMAKLALNGVGGTRAVSFFSLLLGEGAKLVTYGSRKETNDVIGLLPQDFIFRDISLHGFWLSKWSEGHQKEMKETLERLLGYMAAGKLRSSVTPFQLAHFAAALAKSQQGNRQKVVLVFTETTA